MPKTSNCFLYGENRKIFTNSFLLQSLLTKCELHKGTVFLKMCFVPLASIINMRITGGVDETQISGSCCYKANLVGNVGA